MPSKYSVIQFVPDPVTDERINIGVIAFDETGVFVRFLEQWERVRRFSGTDNPFLLDVAKSLRAKASELSGAADETLTQEVVARMPEQWTESVQFSPFRSSMRSASELLQFVSDRFLIEVSSRQRTLRDRRNVATSARYVIRQAVEKVAGAHAEQLVRPNYRVSGKLIPHRFDTVVANGKPYFAAHALSFQSPDLRAVETQADAVAWMLRDVRDQNEDLPMAIVSLPPKAGSSDDREQVYFESRRVVIGLGARFLVEDEVAVWANEVVHRRIPPEQRAVSGAL